MSGDAPEGLLITVGGLPSQMREGCREVNGVLPGPTGNLQGIVNLTGRNGYAHPRLSDQKLPAPPVTSAQPLQA